ncbi:MAG: hypothetical protein ACI4I3_09550 [Acutalibacteraceae bacterium]
MNAKKFSEAMNELDGKYIDEALNYKSNKTNRPVWVRWGAIAACFAVVVALGAGMFHFGLLGSNADKAVLENGDELVFEKSDMVAGSLDLNVETRPLTEEENRILFKDLPGKANAIYAADSGELIGFEGEIENIKITVQLTEQTLTDTVIEGTENNTEINGVSVTAGYFITDPNSRGERNAIYYAAFELGNSKFYLVNSGTKDDSEATKNQLAEVIQRLIENGEPDLSSFDNGK